MKANMHVSHYTFLDFGVDASKTALIYVIINAIGSISLPAYLHEWLATIVALLGVVHIIQKIIYAHKNHKENKNEKNN
jgi:hypothetical protein